MYFSILKKDLKRKKTMNIIMLVFVILSSMFVSSSVNNIVTVTTALDNYFDMAGMSDYYVAVKTMEDEKINLAEMLDKFENISSYKAEPVIYAISTGMINHEGEAVNITNTPLISAFDYSGIKYFYEDNIPVETVNKGEVYIHRQAAKKLDLKIGDKLNITIGEASLDLKIAGFVKDAFIGSDMMSMNRYLLNVNDFNVLYNESAAASYCGGVGFINSDDVSALEAEVSEVLDSALFTATKNTMKMTYMMDTLTAAVLLIFSIFIILIAFVVLRFTINFTLEEEFREIGVMKAIGIHNTKIRFLYLMKYLSISVTGSIIGFFFGIPFGNMLTDSVSKNIVIQSEKGYILNFVTAVLAALFVILFSFRCTGKIKKFTPMDAIRSGEIGERFGRKGIVSLTKSRQRPCLFMAVNDISSSIKRYIVMIITFSLSFLLISVLANTANTLKSDKLVTWFGLQQTDLYISDADAMPYFANNNGKKAAKKRISDIENFMAENDMPGKVSIEVMMKLTAENGDRKCKSVVFYGVGTDTSGYTYIRGTAPQNAGEIAITDKIGEKLNADIGDKIIISELNGKKEYLITAMFQSMSNLGEGIRLHQDADPDFAQLMGIGCYQISFNDKPDAKALSSNAHKLQELFPDTEIMCSGGEYIDDMIGGISSIINGIKMLVIIIVLLISVLIVVLMERSFISKEKSEIALLKAIGFKNNTVICWHVLRIFIVIFVSMVINAVLFIPFTNLLSEPVFKMMGAMSIDFEIKVFEVLAVYPLLMMVFTLFAAWLTAQYMRKITPADTADIE